ncbi:hypothetical protein D9M72_655750 [compost metagenome]
MKQLLRTPVRSASTPNRIGSTKPPSPPARPTTPETAPMLCVKSLEMNLKTEALPMAKAMPTTNSRKVKTVGVSAMRKACGPLMVWMMKSVCG